MNANAIVALSNLLGGVIQIMMVDPFYRDILLSMQAEGRSKPSDEELAAIQARLSGALGQLDSAIDGKLGG